MYVLTVISGLQVAPEYKPHPLFLPKIWQKFIDKSHLSISRTLFCYLSLVWRIKPRWSRYHYCHLGARAACPARDFRREFSSTLLVRAVDGRHILQCSWLPLEWDTTHTRGEREREREMVGGGRVATGLQRQSVIAEYCGWADRDQVLIKACCSVQCVVRGFLETSAHKSHRYISRYPEIFEKKVAAYSPENTVLLLLCIGRCLYLYGHLV